MKKGKLLFLLAAVLSLTILFVACDQTQSEAPTEAGTQGEAVESTEEATIAEIKEEQESAKNEIHNFFDLVKDEDKLLLAEISRIDGEVVSVDQDHNLAVIRTKDLNNSNMVEETVTVYDLLTGEEILTVSVSNAYMADATDRVELSVTVHYPVIRVCYTSCDGEGEDPEYSYDVSYYPAYAGGECIHNTTDNEFTLHNLDNGLVCAEMGDKLVWIDNDMEVIRTVEEIVSGDYDIEGINSEYKGYLYAWDDDELLVFNRSGIVSGRYLAQNDSSIKVNVLNNGNALIQEFTDVGIYESCDFVLNGTRYAMKSSIMNFITGELTEIDLDMVVKTVTTRYEQESNNADAMLLINDSENFGIIYKVANGSISVSADLCVFDNELNVLYTLENDTFGLSLAGGITPLNDVLYEATVRADGYSYLEIFDLNGNSVSAIGYFTGMTDKYIVSSDTIYDYRMNPVYSIKDNGYTFVTVANNNVYLQKRNFVTGGIETYVITPEAKAPVLFTDGITKKCVSFVEGGYILEDVEQDVYRFYNTAGTELLVSHEYISVAKCDDVLVLSTVFNGESVVYVVK